jgi:hypothetical protein
MRGQLDLWLLARQSWLQRLLAAEHEAGREPAWLRFEASEVSLLCGATARAWRTPVAEPLPRPDANRVV